MPSNSIQSRVQKNAALDDIDTDALYKFLETANSVRNLNENTFLPADVILEKLELIKDSGITNATLLLFGKKSGKFFPGHYEIKCGDFPGDEGYDEISNDKEFTGNIIDNFNFSLGFIKSSI